MGPSSLPMSAWDSSKKSTGQRAKGTKDNKTVKGRNKWTNAKRHSLRKETEKRPFSDRRPSQEVAQLSADSYLKCRKKTVEGMERREDGKDHWNISAFSNAASGLGKERFD